MAWFTRQKSGAEAPDKQAGDKEERRVRTEGLWLKCESCSQIIWKKALDENQQCCPRCNHHFRIDARARLAILFDGEYRACCRDRRTGPGNATSSWVPIR